MAKKAVTAEKVAERVQKFQEVVKEKLERSFGPLFVSQLDALTDGQWQTLAKKSRYRARDASLSLVLMGLTVLKENVK